MSGTSERSHPRSVQIKARAKINLSLKVVGKRADGYHLLESIVVFAGVGDVITVTDADGLSLSLEGPFGDALASESDNLVLRAARKLQTEANLNSGAHIALAKHLPVASGIGGGSADAAATLIALNQLWGCGMTVGQLAGLGESLGADVPMCVHGVPAFIEGTGEHVTPLKGFPEGWLVLVNPMVPVSTPAVFKSRQPTFSAATGLPDIPETLAGLAEALKAFPNDLEAPATRLEPEILRVLDVLKRAGGGRLYRMSGSGASCFGLYDSQVAAENAANAIKTARPDWWCVHTALES